MDCASSPIEITWIPVNRIEPNPWNPNRMSSDRLKKLRQEIETRGFMAPILVRPLNHGFQIVDGEHRWRIAKDNRVEKIPCVTAPLDDAEAQIKTLQMNGLKGENEPDRLARLLNELAQEIDSSSLADLLPWSELEIEQMIELAAGQDVDEEIQHINRTQISPPRFELYAVVVTADQKNEIEAAMHKAGKDLGIDDQGAALAMICREYVREKDYEK